MSRNSLTNNAFFFFLIQLYNLDLWSPFKFLSRSNQFFLIAFQRFQDLNAILKKNAMTFFALDFSDFLFKLIFFLFERFILNGKLLE